MRNLDFNIELKLWNYFLLNHICVWFHSPARYFKHQVWYLHIFQKQHRKIYISVVETYNCIRSFLSGNSYVENFKNFKCRVNVFSSLNHIFSNLKSLKRFEALSSRWRFWELVKNNKNFQQNLTISQIFEFNS